MIQNSLTGQDLMEFCHINLHFHAGEVKTPSKSNLLINLQYTLIKKRVSSKIKEAYQLVVVEKIFDFDSILHQIHTDDSNSLWEKLLSYTVIQNVYQWAASAKQPLSEEGKLNSVLKTFLDRVLKLHSKNSEILSLNLQKFKLETEFDLEFAKATAENSRGVFRKA